MLAIVQARMSSARLPGKVLKPLGGRPMLAWLIERLGQARRVSDILVATSTEADDDAIANFCTTAGTGCFRGSLDDVAARFLGAAAAAGAEAFLRISGDSPLIVPALVDEVVALFEADAVDLATNIQLRTFPKGLSVEALRVEALQRARPMMVLGEAEHVTPVFYRRLQDFRIVNLASGHDWGAVQMSVDTPEDFARTERMIRAMGSQMMPPDVAELVALYERCGTRAA